MTDLPDAQQQSTSGPHPLQFKWTLWHDVAAPRSSKGQWAANLKSIGSFDTVEDFWAMFNNLREPSGLNSGNTYNLFKAGIEPKWEDPHNGAGGEWRVSVPNSSISKLDEYWVNTTLTIIGEGFDPDESDDIAGIVVNMKRGAPRIAIWTMTAANETLQMRIGARWKEAVGITMRMEFYSFKDALTSKSRPRARYVIE